MKDDNNFLSDSYNELKKKYISMAMTLETLKRDLNTRKGNTDNSDLKDEIRKLEQSIIEQRELMKDEYTKCNRIRLDQMKEQGGKSL